MAVVSCYHVKSVLLVTHNGTVLPIFFFLIADALGLPVEHVTKVEEEEAPLQKSSIGWVPYTFFARMSSWKQVWLVVVSSL